MLPKSPVPPEQFEGNDGNSSRPHEKVASELRCGEKVSSYSEALRRRKLGPALDSYSMLDRPSQKGLYVLSAFVFTIVVSK